MQKLYGEPSQKETRTLTDHQSVRLPSRKKVAVPATPYGVFVHLSTVYRTSADTESRRLARPSARPGRPRRYPYRPDSYPYADRRWHHHLMAEKGSTVEEDLG